MPTYGDPTGVVGTGVETYDIIRMRSNYLDQKYWGQNKTYQEWNVKQEQLEQIEGVFNEPSDTGIRVVMDEFFTSLEELSKKPGDSTCRTAALEKANSLAISINRNGNELLNAIRDVNFSIKNKVSEVNSLAEQIANLNKHIFNFELNGNKANDLRDQRNVLLDKLSSVVNISVAEMPGPNGNNYMDVKIGGITLINHINYNKLTTEDETVTGITDIGGGKISKVVWAGVKDQEVRIESGELKGLIDVRDGDGKDFNYRGLPYYLNKLNEFAQGFVRSFNNQHAQGIDNDENQGGNFF
jgi:flagellar hook-associated protein 1 FlgK